MLPGHRTADIVPLLDRVPEVAPLALSDGVVCQHHEALLHQAQVHVLVGSIEARLGGMAAGRNNARERALAGCGHVEAGRHPEVGAALEHEILDAVAIPLMRPDDDRVERRAFGQAVNHLD